MQRENKNLLKRILLLVAGGVIIFLILSGVYVYVMLAQMQVDEYTIMALETEHPSIDSLTPSPTRHVSYTPMPTIIDKLLQTPAPTAEPETNDDFGVINIAVFGMDNRYKYTIIGGRSDVIIVLTIDKNTNSVRLTSFIRDMLIYVEPLKDYNRINAAIVYANGPDGAVGCIEQEFGIAIDHYMVTSFVGMSRIIDAVGGVDVYVSSRIRKTCNQSIQEMNPLMGYSTFANYIRKSGNIKLNGIQAVAFMRQRKDEGGFSRDDKQKTVLLAVKEKIKSLSIAQVNDLLEVVSENIKTDMDPLELVEMTMYLYACKDSDYSTIRVPLDNTYQLGWYNKMSVVQYDKDENIPRIFDFIYRGIDPYAQAEE